MDHRLRRKLGDEAGGYCSKPGNDGGSLDKGEEEGRHQGLDSGSVFKVEPTGFGWNLGFERTRGIRVVQKSFEEF